MKTVNLQAIQYNRVLASGNLRQILGELEKGADVNQKGIYSAMEVFIGRGYAKGIAAVLANPDFNPNTKSVDGLYLIERAMLRSEKLALRIMAHPRFDIKQRLSLGRTLAMSAVVFSKPNIFKVASAYTAPTDIDQQGRTLSTYLQEYGRPTHARLARIRKNFLSEHQKLVAQKANDRYYV